MEEEEEEEEKDGVYLAWTTTMDDRWPGLAWGWWHQSWTGAGAARADLA